MNKCLLDTDIFSEIMKRKNAAVSKQSEGYFNTYGKFTLSHFTVFEITYGLKYIHQEQRLLETLLTIGQHEVLPLTFDAAVIAGKITADLDRTGQTIGKIDPFIAAVAISNNLPLATGNTSHYERIIKLGYPLQIENWKE